MKLSELKPGSSFRIQHIESGGEISRRLVDMGLNRNEEGSLLRCALLGSPLEIRIRNYLLSLRRSEASLIEVVALDPEPQGGE